MKSFLLLLTFILSTGLYAKCPNFETTSIELPELKGGLTMNFDCKNKLIGKLYTLKVIDHRSKNHEVVKMRTIGKRIRNFKVARFTESGETVYEKKLKVPKKERKTAIKLIQALVSIFTAETQVKREQELFKFYQLLGKMES